MRILSVFKPRFKAFWIFLGTQFGLLLLVSGSAKGQPIHSYSELTTGDLPLLSSILGKDGYAPQIIQKLANPVLIWSDQEWFTNRGFAGSEKELVEVLGFASRIADEPVSAYLDSFQTWYADRYGGWGMGSHLGSGRAGSKGAIQIKGIGQTKLLSPFADQYHSNGAAYLSEGIFETISSQILDRELPYGANRVIALIATGTFVRTMYKGELYIEPRALIVREDPLRPAHLIRNGYASDKDRDAETRRIQNVMENITELFSHAIPESKYSLDQADDSVRSGFFSFLRRMAETQAYMFSHSLYKGDFSPSNVELSGKALDFGRFTSFWGYPKANMLSFIKPFGDNSDVIKVLTDVAESLSDQLVTSARIIQKLPSTSEIVTEFEGIYKKSILEQMVALTGYPPELLKKVTDRDAISQLGNVLLEIAIAGNYDLIDVSEKIPVKTGTYDLPQILRGLAKTAMAKDVRHGLNSNYRFNVAITDLVPDTLLRERLAKSYFEFDLIIRKIAESQGISLTALRRFRILAVEQQNQKVPELMQDVTFFDKYSPMINEFGTTWNPRNIGNTIDEAIIKGRRTYPASSPFELTLREQTGKKGFLERRLFDLFSGRIVVRKYHSKQYEPEKALHEPENNLFQCETLLN